MTAIQTPAGELASWIAVLAGMRWQAEITHAIGCGPHPPASIVDTELAIGALVMARYPGPLAAFGVTMLLSQRAAADVSPEDDSDAAFQAWGDRWDTYRRTCRLAESVLVESHADPAARARWMEVCS